MPLMRKAGMGRVFVAALRWAIRGVMLNTFSAMSFRGEHVFPWYVLGFGHGFVLQAQKSPGSRGLVRAVKSGFMGFGVMVESPTDICRWRPPRNPE